MLATPGKCKALMVISSICLASGILVILFGIGVEVAARNYGAVGAGIGYMIGLALPLIIPSVFGIVAGKKEQVRGFHIAYLVLVILSIIWLFSMTIVLIITAIGLTAVTVNVSNPGSDYYTIYGLYIVITLLALVCWCLELAGSIISCIILCTSDPQQMPGQAVVVTTGYPAGNQAPPYDAKI